jgi:hypothetical protein
MYSFINHENSMKFPIFRIIIEKERIMKNKKFFNIISTILLAWLPIFTTCTNAGPVSYDNLEVIIAEAEEEYKNTNVASNGNNVELGTYWVTFQVKNNFELDIAAAKAALNSTSQMAVNKATRDMADKIEEFKIARQPGTAVPVNKTGLSAKIAEAELEKLFVAVASSPEEVAQGRKYVPQSVMDTLETGIKQAKDTLTSSNQDQVNTMTNSLDTKITIFMYTRNEGTKSTDFTQTDLNDLLEFAEAIKDKFKISDKNGDDVGPAEYWVNESYFRDFNNAITVASNPDGNIDNVYLFLISAINTISANKKIGSTADKNSLFDAIRSADTVKSGVVVAVNAAAAPFGYKWATKTQWSQFNSVYTNALNAARDPNAVKKDVDDRIFALLSATITFNSAVNNNGPGTKLNTIAINGLPYDYNGCQIDVYLFESSNFKIGEQQGYGSGKIQNNATGEIKLSPRSGITSINGSWYVVLVINNEPKQYYISKSEVTFTATSNVVTNITYYKKYVFKERFGDITAKNGVPSSVRTLDDLFQYMEDITYSQLLEWELLPGKLYKNEALTQPFNGSEVLTANTYIYCEFSLMDSLGTISNKYIIPLTANTWKNGSINKYYCLDLYSISVTSGRKYYLWWNDYREGDGSKTLDIDVYAYKSGNNPIPLENNDDAWDKPVSFTASSSGKVYIRVRAYDGGQFTGTYAIMYNTSGVMP